MAHPVIPHVLSRLGLSVKIRPSSQVLPEDLESYSLDGSQASMANTDFYTEPYKVYYITNNVPYIVRLNEGHSQQAASHWVERIFQGAVRQT